VRFRHKQGDYCCPSQKPYVQPSTPVNHTPVVEKPRYVFTLVTTPVVCKPLECSCPNGLFYKLFGNTVCVQEYGKKMQRASCNAGRNVTKLTHAEMVSEKARLQSYLRGVKTPTTDVIGDVALLAMLNRRV